MKTFSSFINEAVKRSKIKPDSKTGDEDGVGVKNDTVGTVNITDEKIDEISAELVGKVNKARLDKPAKTKEADKTRAQAVRKAWLNSKVGKIKEENITEGRPKKNATEDDPGSEHVVMQLRKVISTRGQHKVKHVSGETSDVSPAHAHKMLAHHDNLKTSSEKDSYAKRLHRSPSSMKDAMAGKAETHKPKISLGGKITGTQNEAVGVDTTLKATMPHVTMAKTARNKATNAPASSGPSQTAATNRSAALQKNAETEARGKKDAAEGEIEKRKAAEKARNSVAPKPPKAPEAKPMSAPKI